MCFQALDLDSTDSIQYQFAGGESTPFSINALSGQISTLTALDYNVKNRYIFGVTTSEGALNPGLRSVSTSVTVIVNVSTQFLFFKR